MANAQAVLPRFCESNSPILGSACHAIASKSGPALRKLIDATAHAVFVRFCSANCDTVRIACAESACSRGACVNCSLAQAHAVLATLCGSNCRICFMAAEAIAFIRCFHLLSLSLAKAQAVLDRFWTPNAWMVATDGAAIASRSGPSLISSVAQAQAMLVRFCG